MPELNLVSIAFYNLENFFDTVDDPNTDDDAFTPKGIMHWVRKRFENKAKKIAKSISKIGFKETHTPPALIGLAEVENKRVIQAIVKQRYLRKYHYGYIHFESADKRGMDVALLYQKTLVDIKEHKVYPVVLYNNQGEAYKTRDILYVKAKLAGQIIHLYINHWPSRREGGFESNIKRYQAVMTLEKIIDYTYYEEPESIIIVMGDFNTDPDDPLLKNLYKHLFNPAQDIYKHHIGSLNHRHHWHLFDQIMFSHNLFNSAHLKFRKFEVFAPDFLKNKANTKNLPYRTYQGRHYTGGYSDHFPVYVLLALN